MKRFPRVIIPLVLFFFANTPLGSAADSAVKVYGDLFPSFHPSIFGQQTPKTALEDRCARIAPRVRRLPDPEKAALFLLVCLTNPTLDGSNASAVFRMFGNAREATATHVAKVPDATLRSEFRLSDAGLRRIRLMTELLRGR